MTTMHILSLEKQYVDNVNLDKNTLVELLAERIPGTVVWHKIRELQDAWQILAIAT
jgi:hypothetical protein